MFKRLLLGALLSASAVAAHAQSTTESRKQHLRNQYYGNDTAQAIINLYGRRQAGGAGWIVSSALAGARLATADASSTSVNGVVVEREKVNPGVAFLVAGPIMAYGVSKLVRFGNGKLEKTLADYAAGKPLPHNLRRKLKPRFFPKTVPPATQVSTK